MSEQDSKSISFSSIEDYVWRVTRILFKYGVDNAFSDVAPLKWYIASGRASNDFLLALVSAKPYMVARKLHGCGSYSDAIERVKKYIGFKAIEDE